MAPPTFPAAAYAGGVPLSPVLYAHRGASFELPENTLEAFALALAIGAHALETDAHLTRDGQVVLSHDPGGARMADVPRMIAECTLAELRGWDVGARFVPRGADARPTPRPHYRMPTLAEALESFPDVTFNVDAKDDSDEMVGALLAVVRAARATARVRVASFSAQNLRRARASGYEGETSLSPLEVASARLLPRAVAQRLVRGRAAQVPPVANGIRLDTPRAIARFHALGLRVDYWTIDDPAVARDLLARGADGIMTDDPRSVIAAFAP